MSQCSSSGQLSLYICNYFSIVELQYNTTIFFESMQSRILAFLLNTQDLSFRVLLIATCATKLFDGYSAQLVLFTCTAIQLLLLLNLHCSSIHVFLTLGIQNSTSFSIIIILYDGTHFHTLLCKFERGLRRMTMTVGGEGRIQSPTPPPTYI